MAVDLIGGAAVGAAFGELLKAVLEIKDKAINFGQTLAYLRTTLVAVAPAIKEIEQQNKDLGRPKEELESLIREMEEATKLVYKCSKVHKLNFPARIRYQEQMGKLVESLVRIFMIDMQAHTARDVKETLIKVRRIHSAVNKLPFLISDEDHITGETEMCSESMQPNHENEIETFEPETLEESKSTHPAKDAARTNFDYQILQEINSVSLKDNEADKSISMKCYDEQRFISIHLSLSIHLPKFKWILHKNKKNKFNDQVMKDPYEPREIDTIKKCLILNKFDLEDLLSASTEVIGETNYGTTYKAILKDGTTLVMKRLKDVVVEKEEFEKQMEIVQRVSQHPNVMPLLAWFYDEKLLVYEYMPTGSFSLLLHGTREAGWTPLDWDTRMKISLGVAKGIAHIHSVSGGKYFHGNISSSNVLITPDFQGRISDLVLTCLVSDSQKEGYQAPKVTQTNKLTQKSDVYSFGVLLLEMLTAKLPLECDDGLASWVEFYIMEGILKDVLDDAIITNNLQCCRKMLQLAMACLGTRQRFWEQHPTISSMDEVVREMEEIIASKSN